MGFCLNLGLSKISAKGVIKNMTKLHTVVIGDTLV